MEFLAKTGSLMMLGAGVANLVGAARHWPETASVLGPIWSVFILGLVVFHIGLFGSRR